MLPAVAGQFERGPSGQAESRCVLTPGQILDAEQPRGRLFLPDAFLGPHGKVTGHTVVDTQVMNPMCWGLDLNSSH